MQIIKKILLLATLGTVVNASAPHDSFDANQSLTEAQLNDLQIDVNQMKTDISQVRTDIKEMQSSLCMVLGTVQMILGSMQIQVQQSIEQVTPKTLVDASTQTAYEKTCSEQSRVAQISQQNRIEDTWSCNERLNALQYVVVQNRYQRILHPYLQEKAFQETVRVQGPQQIKYRYIQKK